MRWPCSRMAPCWWVAISARSANHLVKLITDIGESSSSPQLPVFGAFSYSTTAPIQSNNSWTFTAADPRLLPG